MTDTDEYDKKYKYHLLSGFEMDTIKKRSSTIKTFLSISISLVVLGLLYVKSSRPLHVHKLSNITDTETIQSVSTKDYDSYFDHQKMVTYIGTVLSCWMITFFFVSLFHRICLLPEEFRHKNTRYNGSCQKLLRFVFVGGWNWRMYGIGLIMLILCYLMNPQVVCHNFNSNFNLYSVATVFLVLYQTNKKWSDAEFQHSKSYVPTTGSFMAYAAYYSYYKDILPSLKDRIKEAECELDISIPVKKLIILFPSSGQVPNRLDHGTDDMELKGHLSDIKRNKGGTFGRQFNNPIYKISPKNKKTYYCVVEGQNSIAVLKSMNQSNELFKQQAYLLYKTLKEILEDSGEKNTYILFPYDDDDENNQQSLAERIWNKLEEEIQKYG